MAYEHLEEIGDRKSEKMALFLTAENVGGLLVCAGPIYLLSTHWPLLLRLLAVGGAAALGVALTSRVHGLPLYTRILWHVQGAVWTATGRRLVVLDQLLGSSRRTPQRMLLGARAPARIVRRPAGEPLSAVAPRVARRAPLVTEPVGGEARAARMPDAPALVSDAEAPDSVEASEGKHVVVFAHEREQERDQ